MSQYDIELHKFISGEIRTDGWVSDWRREQEQRRAEEMGKRVFVAATQIKRRQTPQSDHRRATVRKSLQKIRGRLPASPKN